MTIQVALLLASLLAVNLIFFVRWYKAANLYKGRKRPMLIEILVGLVVAFFDTLGIGSFAPTTAILKFQGKITDD